MNEWIYLKHEVTDFVPNKNVEMCHLGSHCVNVFKHKLWNHKENLEELPISTFGSLVFLVMG